MEKKTNTKHQDEGIGKCVSIKLGGKCSLLIKKVVSIPMLEGARVEVLKHWYGNNLVISHLDSLCSTMTFVLVL